MTTSFDASLREVYLRKLSEEISALCSRPGMYIGDTTLNHVEIYINAMLHGASVVGIVSFKEWRDWVYELFPDNKGQVWSVLLSNKYGTERDVIEAIPRIFNDFINHKVNT